MSLVLKVIARVDGEVNLDYKCSQRCYRTLIICVPVSLWCRLHLGNKNTCSVNLIYCLPTSTSDMDSKLNHFSQVVSNMSSLYLRILGHFNAQHMEKPTTLGAQFTMVNFQLHSVQSQDLSHQMPNYEQDVDAWHYALQQRTGDWRNIPTHTTGSQWTCLYYIWRYIPGGLPKEEDNEVHSAAHYNLIYTTVKPNSSKFLTEYSKKSAENRSKWRSAQWYRTRRKRKHYIVPEKENHPQVA